MVESASQHESGAARPRERRFFIGIGNADPGAQSRLRRLPGVPSDLERMRALFVEQLGYEDVALSGRAGSPNLELTANELQEALHAFRLRAQPGEADSVVFYFTGHGHNHGSVHYLCTNQFHADDPSSGLETRRLAQLLPHHVRRLWVILDICRAGDGADALCEAVLRDRALYLGSVWVLAACGQAVALDQAFSSAFVVAAARFVSAGGCPSLDALARRVQKHLGGKRALQRIQQSCYGSEAFDFFGDRYLASKWFSPSRASQVLPGSFPERDAASPRVARAKGLAALRGSAASAADARVFRREPRRVWWAASAVLLLTALACAALLLGRRNAALAGQTQRPSSTRHPERVTFAAGVARLASTREEARLAYHRCSALGECTMPFASSSFAAEVHTQATAKVASFSLARLEVSQREFAAWLNTKRAALRRERASEDEELLDESQHVLASVGARAATEATGIFDDQTVFRVDPSRDEEPVSQVSWYGADAFCRAQGGRLPSEAEWAYASRGSEGRTFPWGEQTVGDCDAAVFARAPERECATLPSRPLPSGRAQRDVSPDGVRELAGNLSEWTSTVFLPDSAQRSLTGCRERDVADQTCRVVRGGSYRDSRQFLRGAARTALSADAYWRAIGFRCAWDVR